MVNVFHAFEVLILLKCILLNQELSAFYIGIEY